MGANVSGIRQIANRFTPAATSALPGRLHGHLKVAATASVPKYLILKKLHRQLAVTADLIAHPSDGAN